MTKEDEKKLQRDLDKVTNWSDTWFLNFHPDKCKNVHIGGPGQTKNHSYTLHDNKLNQVTERKILRYLLIKILILTVISVKR